MRSMGKIFWVVHHLPGLLIVDTKELRKYYSGGKRSTNKPDNDGQIMTAGHRSRLLLIMDIREW